MKNTAETSGKTNIMSLIKSTQSKSANNIIHLLAIRDEQGYQNAVDVMEHLMLSAPDTPDNPYHDFMILLGNAIQAYEHERFPVEKSSPVDILNFLMEQNSLKQADLLEIFGTRSIVSEVLSGKRELSKRHIKALSERFRVSPSVFFA